MSRGFYEKPSNINNELSNFVINNENIVIYNTETKKWFAGFKTDTTPKWTNNIFKAYLFPYPNKWNVELKMHLRLLTRYVNIEKLHKLAFKQTVSNVDIDIGGIGNNLNKKTDLDNINNI